MANTVLQAEVKRLKAASDIASADGLSPKERKKPTFQSTFDANNKILESLVFPRSINDYVNPDRMNHAIDPLNLPNRSQGSQSRFAENSQLLQLVNELQSDSSSSSIPNFICKHFFHAMLMLMFFIYSFIRGAQYIYRVSRLRVLQLLYSPSQSPQLIRQDILKLNKIPTRLATILDFKSEDEEAGGLSGLLIDAGEVVSWSIAAGIPELTIFEYNGILKQNVPQLINSINKTLSNYFGLQNLPSFLVKIPRTGSIIYGNGKTEPDGYLTNPNGNPEMQVVADIQITLLSVRDGKKTIVDLTKSISELVANGDIQPEEVTMGLLDEEITELSGYEPDLLISFGPELDLQGYPPWQIRLSELYWEPDNNSVNYVVFYNALNKFSHCKVNVGK